MTSVPKNKIIAMGGFPNAPYVVKKHGRKYLSLPLSGGKVGLLLPIIQETPTHYTVVNPLLPNTILGLVKIPKNNNDVAKSFALASFV